MISVEIVGKDDRTVTVKLTGELKLTIPEDATAEDVVEMFKEELRALIIQYS